MSTKLPTKKSIWTESEISKVRELWGTMKNVDLAVSVGKTISALTYLATKLNLRQEKGYRAGGCKHIPCRRWTNREHKILIDSIGHLSTSEIEKRLPGRSWHSIETKCYDLGYSTTQGTFSCAMIEKETGYDWRQIKRARDRLGQTWKRYGKRKFIITEDQRDDIIEYLKCEVKKWSIKYDLDACIKCGASGLGPRDSHAGDGLCKRCVDARRYERHRIVELLKNNQLVEISIENYNKGAHDTNSTRES